MMNMKEFLAKVAADKALAEKMKGAADPDSAYAIAKEAGLTDSFETFADTMSKLNAASNELNADEVDAITGGSNVTLYVLTATAISVEAAGVATAASAATV